MVVRITAILFAFAACLLGGCGVGVNNLRSLGYHSTKVGDRVVLATDAVIVDCEGRDTAASFWTESRHKRHCLYPVSQVHASVPSTPVRAGTAFTVARVKYVNGIDRAWYVLNLAHPEHGQELVVEERVFPELLGIPKWQPEPRD